VDEIAPPAHVWSNITAQLPAGRERRPGLWESMAFWRVFALASTLAAVCLAIFIFVSSGQRQEPLVASIEGGGQRHFVATIDPARGSIAIVPAAFSADATRVPELWLIPADGKPRPLGLLSPDHAVTLALPAQLAGQARRNAVLAVSLEPPGGSPTGLPTGPVIGTGALTAL
jgi:anti-sigma-K factor RskA